MIGQKAPEFKAQAFEAGEEKEISLSQYKGKWVVLFFYPLDFTFVCPTEIQGFARKAAEFQKLNAVVLGCSTDSFYSHKAWFEKDLPQVKFPVIADTNHAVSRAYGVLKEDSGVAFRGTFIIDPQGILKSMTINDLPVGRSVEETLRTLQAMQTGDLVPCEWKPGQKTLGKA